MSVAKYREIRAKRKGTWEPPPPPVPAPPVVYPAILPGTRIVRETRLSDSDGQRYGWALMVDPPDLSVTAASFQTAIPFIARAFGTVDEGVRVFPTPDNRLVKVEIVEAWWLAQIEATREARMGQVHPWPGPTLDIAQGRFAFGVSADGATMHWRLWVPKDGARHGWFIGRTGSGKTGTMGTCLLSAVTAGVVLPVIIDMAGGASLGEWKDRGVPYADNPKDALILLKRLELEEDRRAQWMADGCGTGKPVKWLPAPTREVPYIMPVLDEFPDLAAYPEGSEAIGRALRKWRKYMMGVVLASQGHQAAHAFGWAAGDVARQQIKSGNVAQLNGSVNSMVEVLDLKEDMSNVGQIPRDQQGGVYFRGHDHPDVTRGRGFYEEDIPTALDRYADIPDYDLPYLPKEATAEPVEDPKAAASCYDAVAQVIASADGDVIYTSKTNEALSGRWSTSTISDALRAHAKDGHLTKDGHDRWRIQ